MKAKNFVKFTFESRSANEAFARSAVGAFLVQLDPTLDELADVKTAVSEAVTNCIIHAYPEKIGLIYITVRVYEDNSVSVLVADKGVGIENVPLAMQPLYTTGNKEERAGLGFAVMESFMDHLKVRSTLGRGTQVLMKKTISKRG